MVPGGVFAVALETIGERGVTDIDLAPVIGVVAAAAVFAVVAGGGVLEMALGALVDGVAFFMVELRLGPGPGIVTAGALARIMVLGGVLGVAVLAVLEALVVEVGVSPALGGVVAGGAVFPVVVGGLVVAILAVLIVDVAFLAIAEVVARRGFGLVTGETIRDAGVVESQDGPIVGVLVAVDAGLGVKGMERGCFVESLGVLEVAGEAFDYVLVIEGDGVPTDGVMAILAGAVEVFGVVEVRVGGVFLGERSREDGVGDLDDGLELMAVGALGRGADILAVGVAGEAVGVGVSAFEGVAVVVDLLAEEGDGHSADDGGGFGDGADGVRGVVVLRVLAEEGIDAGVQDVDGLAAGLIDGEDDEFGLFEQCVEIGEDEVVLVLVEVIGVGQEGGESLVEGDGGSLDGVGVLGVGQVGEAAFGQGEGQASAVFAFVSQGEAALFGDILEGVEAVARMEGIGFRQVVEAGEGGY
jgi:hypothetical protein